MSTAPPPSQARLAELLAERVEWVTGRSQGEPDPGTAQSTVQGEPDPGTAVSAVRAEPDPGTAVSAVRAEPDPGTAVSAVRAEPDPGTAESAVLVLLRSVRLADLVHGAREFAAALEPAAAAAWRRSWTRTLFLFGNPANLIPSIAARVVAPGGSAAWLGPFPDARWPGVSRLLKPVSGGLPELPRDLDLPGTGPRRVLQVAVGGLRLVDYLVHLHHTLAEAVLLGRLRPEEPLRLSHRPALGPDPGGGPPAYARVLPEPGGSGRLRLHTWLSAA